MNTNILSVIKAFIIKDAKIEKRYHLHFLFQFLKILTTLTIYYFLSKLIIYKNTDYSIKSYFSFILIGISFFSILRVGLTAFTEELIRSINTGVLESLMMSPVPASLIILCSSIWKHIFNFFRIFMYFIIGIFLFNANIMMPDIFSLIVVIILSLIIFSSLGLISSSLVIFVKRSDPVNWILGQIFFIFGGVLFPVKILPAPLQVFSKMIPLTYALDSFRSIFLSGHNIVDFKKDVLILFIFACVLAPLSLFIFNRMIKKAKASGTLYQH
ncbi:MAG: ABC transporter permease [Candidatus Aureabacteria bacterium]|nr:ABC transporter permease [Candidatus Auribacterota bacterium]